MKKIVWGAAKELEGFEYAVVSFWGPSLLTYKMGRKIPILITL